ncbi:hypothetical protein TWF281_009119 [Arthrobotrys megalospora]
MDLQHDADTTPRPNRVQPRVLEHRGVSRLSFASSSFTTSSSITINSLLNTDSPTLSPTALSGQTDFLHRSGLDLSSISEPVSRSPSPRKRRHPSSNQYETETTSRKSSRSNSRHSSVSSKSLTSDASAGVRRIEFPKGIKESTKRYYSNRCWLCEHPNRKLNVAHVIPRADTEFEAQVSRGILPLSELHDINNAIPLCVACHDPFDARPPGFIILPIDLAWFLDFERADFSDRQRLLREGKSRRRIVPTGQMYRAHLEREAKLAAFPSPGAKGVNRAVSNECQDLGGLYEVYVRTDHLSNHWNDEKILGLFLRGKIWHGSPTALILHAARVLSYPHSGEAWIDDEKLRSIFELILLWGREPTPPLNTDGNSEDSESEGVQEQPPPDPKSDNKDPRGNDGPPRPPGSHYSSKGGSVPSETVVGTEGDGLGDCDWSDRSASLVDMKMSNRWQWGPKLTANDVVTFFSSVGI